MALALLTYLCYTAPPVASLRVLKVPLLDSEVCEIVSQTSWTPIVSVGAHSLWPRYQKRTHRTASWVPVECPHRQIACDACTHPQLTRGTSPLQALARRQPITQGYETWNVARPPQWPHLPLSGALPLIPGHPPGALPAYLTHLHPRLSTQCPSQLMRWTGAAVPDSCRSQQAVSAFWGAGVCSCGDRWPHCQSATKP